jgi:hypothetical protein
MHLMKRSPLRFPALAAGMLSLVVGLWAGLGRLGWPLPEPRVAFNLVHGPLMISGFLGTLIGAERAVALGKTWAFVAPAFTALAALALILGVPGTAPALLAVAGSLGLAIVLVAVVCEERHAGTAVMAFGAFAWVAGNALWLSGFPVPRVVSWWMAFLVLTITGERLELSRVLHLAHGRQLAFGGTIAMLHASLALRLVGDLSAFTTLRTWGGTLNVASIVLFLLNTARAALAADLGGRLASERMLASSPVPGGST